MFRLALQWELRSGHWLLVRHLELLVYGSGYSGRRLRLLHLSMLV
jgi:hypothetical protein